MPYICEDRVDNKRPFLVQRAEHCRKRNWKEASLCRILNISDFYVHENALSAPPLSIHLIKSKWMDTERTATALMFISLLRASSNSLFVLCKYVQHDIKAQIHKFSQQMVPFAGEKFSLLLFSTLPLLPSDVLSFYVCSTLSLLTTA